MRGVFSISSRKSSLFSKGYRDTTRSDSSPVGVSGSPLRLPRQGLPAIIMKSPAGLRFRRRLGVIDDIKKVYDAFFRVVGIFPRHTGLSSAKNINGYE